ncbi:hypothetical protein D3C74_335230 [compost metagenome]
MENFTHGEGIGGLVKILQEPFGYMLHSVHPQSVDPRLVQQPFDPVFELICCCRVVLIQVI